jgi:hypothetical protein
MLRQRQRVLNQNGQGPAHQRRLETLYSEPGSPWENCYNESIDGKLRDGRPNREIFNTLAEAQLRPCAEVIALAADGPTPRSASGLGARAIAGHRL